jgi:hypothetical protein
MNNYQNVTRGSLNLEVIYQAMSNRIEQLKMMADADIITIVERDDLIKEAQQQQTIINKIYETVGHIQFDDTIEIEASGLIMKIEYTYDSKAIVHCYHKTLSSSIVEHLHNISDECGIAIINLLQPFVDKDGHEVVDYYYLSDNY